MMFKKICYVKFKLKGAQGATEQSTSLDWIKISGILNCDDGEYES
jgi:hypothetical protein